MAQATEIKKTLIELTNVIKNLVIEISEFEAISIEKEVKPGKQIKQKKFSKLLSKIIKKSKHNANYLKEQIPISKFKNASHRSYAIY